LLKHIEGLSDEVLCERRERDPYMEYIFVGKNILSTPFHWNVPAGRTFEIGWVMRHWRRRQQRIAAER
jgi:hypothetical protein